MTLGEGQDEISESRIKNGSHEGLGHVAFI